MTAKTPANVKLWRATSDARAKAKRLALVEEQRDRMADYVPPNVRTYGISSSGIDYDAAIRAAAVSAVPMPSTPNRGRRG
jgi:hypothetical protein